MRSNPGVAVAYLLCVAGLALPGCREDVSPFEANDRGGTVFETGQLTFSLRDDRSPTWSTAGDSIYYSAEGYGHLPPDPGVLVGLPAGGGTARPILANVQLPSGTRRQRWLVAPAASPDGESVAFAEITRIQEALCDPDLYSLVCEPQRDEALLPPLARIAISIRRLDATGAPEDDPRLYVNIPGVEHVEGPNPYDAAQFHRVHDYPFQQLFAQERSFVFRASWAPDGERLVLSDGVRLLVWTADSPAVVAVPGSGDGVGPAWSPDGEWIAFSRLERADSTQAVCLFMALGVACAQERTDYSPGERVLTIIRPDGSDATELAEGDEPAWSPDARTLFFRRDDQIWRIGLDRSGLAPVPGTERGREPAVSPDGRHLAFARLSPDGDYDIWIVSLQP